MNNSEKTYLQIGRSLAGAEESQMFGKPCFKIKGKAFICLFNDDMVFKLSGNDHKAAMELKASVLFDPSGRGRAMKEWVQVSKLNSAQWPELAPAAMKYVGSLTK